MAERPVTTEEVLSALRAGGVRITDKHKAEAEFQAAAARGDEARRSLRQTLANIRRDRARRV